MLWRQGEDRAAGPKARRAAAEGLRRCGCLWWRRNNLRCNPGHRRVEFTAWHHSLWHGKCFGAKSESPQGSRCGCALIYAAAPLRASGQITCLYSRRPPKLVLRHGPRHGVHAELMSAARRAGKSVAGRAAYYAAGCRLLFNHPVQSFDIEITTVSGSVLRDQACEAVAVRVAELNRWRPGGGLHFPFLRLATVRGNSRSRLARASFDALFRSAGVRDHAPAEDAAASLSGCGARTLPSDSRSGLQPADRDPSGRRGTRCSVRRDRKWPAWTRFLLSD